MSATPPTDDATPKKKRTKVPPAAEPKTDAAAEAKAPERPSGNAELGFKDAECEITSSVSVKSSTSEIRKCTFGLRVPVEPGTDALSLGIAPAAERVAEACEYIEEGTNSVKQTVKRDWRVQRYVIDPDGKGQGIELLAEVKGSVAVHVDPKGKMSASWTVQARLEREVFDRLLELRNLPLRLSTHAIQGDITDARGDEQLPLH